MGIQNHDLRIGVSCPSLLGLVWTSRDQQLRSLQQTRKASRFPPYPTSLPRPRYLPIQQTISSTSNTLDNTSIITFTPKSFTAHRNEKYVQDQPFRSSLYLSVCVRACVYVFPVPRRSANTIQYNTSQSQSDSITLLTKSFSCKHTLTS